MADIQQNQAYNAEKEWRWYILKIQLSRQNKLYKKLSYRRETARQLRMYAQLTRCFSAVAV